jgi:hypothetical protein
MTASATPENYTTLTDVTPPLKRRAIFDCCQRAAGTPGELSVERVLAAKDSALKSTHQSIDVVDRAKLEKTHRK